MEDPTSFEEQCVKDVYNYIAHDFDKSRYSVWNCVEKFLESLLKQDISCRVADVGCGNGKNMMMSPRNFIGIDACESFVKICMGKGLNAIIGSILQLPLKTNSVDHSICIAVIHHLSTMERRQLAIKELLRITKPGGKILVLVWNDETINHKKCRLVREGNYQDVMVSWKGTLDEEMWRYYHLFLKNELDDLILSVDSNVSILETFEEKGNYGVIFSKTK